MTFNWNLALCCSDSIEPFIRIMSIVDYEHISEASLIDN